LLALQRQAGNRAVVGLVRRALQRSSIGGPPPGHGYTALPFARSFARDHLAEDEEGARTASEARAADDRGITANTVLQSDEETVRTSVLEADYDRATHIRGQQWGVPVTLPYWQVQMAVGGNGVSVVRNVQPLSTGTIRLKVHFDESRLKVSVAGVQGSD
jgi:hypothetical protein